MCVSSYGYCFKMPEFVNFVNFVMAKKSQCCRNAITSQPAIEPEHRLQAVCTDPLLGDYCVIIVWLLCDTSAMFVQSFHIAIITSTKTYVRRGCYISLLASSQQHTIGERRYDQLVVGCQASADTDVNILAQIQAVNHFLKAINKLHLVQKDVVLFIRTQTLFDNKIYFKLYAIIARI